MSVNDLGVRLLIIAPRVAARVKPRGLPLLLAAVATAIVLGIRLVFASKVQFCGGADACFYLSLAREIAFRHDFLLNFVWNYQVDHAQLPSAALEFWRPGTSLLLVLASAFGDITVRLGAVLATIATILTALAAADLTWTLTRNRWTTLLGYVIGLCLPSFWPLALSADSAAFYGAAVGWFLVLFTVENRSRLRDHAAIFCIAVAYLVRNDAIVLAAPFAAVLAIRTMDQRRSGTLRRNLPYTLQLAAAFLLALVPTHLLIWFATGRFGNGSTEAVLFFRSLADFSRYGSRLDFAAWAAAGFGSLLEERLSVLVQITHHLLVRFGEPATVMALVGTAAAMFPRSRPGFARNLIGPLVFLISIVSAYAIIMPGIGDHSALRSYTGMLPVLAALAAVGIVEAAASRPTLIVLAIGVVAYSAIDGVNQARTMLNDDRESLAEYEAEGRIVEGMKLGHGAALALVQNPAVFTTVTGIRSIPLPTNGPSAVRKAADDFGATAIVVDKWSEVGNASDWLRAAPRQDVPNSRMTVISLARHGGGLDR
jgi:hypothetical protein